jgi:hypothetical protein
MPSAVEGASPSRQKTASGTGRRLEGARARAQWHRGPGVAARLGGGPRPRARWAKSRGNPPGRAEDERPGAPVRRPKAGAVAWARADLLAGKAAAAA